MPRKPDFISVTEIAWKKAMSEILKRTHTVLDSAKNLLDNNGNETVCAGLYTFAVEEYGKLLLLKKYSATNGIVKIKYRDEYCHHPTKFNEAIACLPKECINLRQGVFDPAIFDPKVFDTQTVTADFDARLAIFYTDFNNTFDDVLPIPPVEKDKLRKAIDSLKAIIAQTVIL